MKMVYSNEIRNEENDVPAYLLGTVSIWDDGTVRFIRPNGDLLIQLSIEQLILRSLIMDVP